MDVVVIFNGLGNQMSQYAFYLNKKRAQKHTRYIYTNTGHNGIELNKIFSINLRMGLLELFLLFLYKLYSRKDKNPLIHLAQLFFKPLNVSLYTENYNYAYQSEVMQLSKGIRFLVGGWHNENYFCKIKDEIKDLFVFKRPLSMVNEELLSQVDYDNAVAIHIRRGDYLSGTNYELFGKVCSNDYYKKAIDYICQHIESPVFYIFSNDLAWASDFMKDYSFVVVDKNAGEDAWQDMALMSKFKYKIIANSTFSWWAAWLTSNKSLVVCPQWLIYNDPSSDIFLKDWIHI